MKYKIHPAPKYKISGPCIQMNQDQFGPGGKIKPPENRQLLTKIDTIEFPKWELKVLESSSGTVFSWINVLGVDWICFGCNMSCFKHAPFCHSSCSYKKRETDRNDDKILDVPVSSVLSQEDLLTLSIHEAKFVKK